MGASQTQLQITRILVDKFTKIRVQATLNVNKQIKSPP